MLVCLLPVRNGADHLEAWLESAERFADAVVALDDGSTDATASLLEGSPLVARVLRNPPRPGWLGWNDAVNRQRLLDASGDLEPDWVMWLDADERVTPDDAQALRRFVHTDADPAFAYGFRIHDMIGDAGAFDPATRWVYRLHAYRPGARLPDQRLHFVPVPVDVPRRRWLRTTLRIQHFGMCTPERRHERIEKYRQVDPGCVWQPSYDHLRRAPALLARWQPRTSDRVVLPVHRDAGDDRPDLSVIVISHDDAERIDRVLDAVLTQEVAGTWEVIVVVSGTDGTAERVRRRAGVTVVDLGPRATPGAARNAGLAVARGDFVAFPSSHVLLEPGSLSARLQAHRQGWAMVSGPVGNGVPTSVGWAAWFLDHAGTPPGRPSGPMAHAPARCSYVRFLLEEVGGFPDARAGEDTAVNLELFARGYSAFFCAEALETYLPTVDTVAALCRKHYGRGQAWARIRRERAGGRAPRRIRAYARRRLRSALSHRGAWGPDVRRHWWRSLPLVLAGIASSRLGLVTGARAGGSPTEPRTSARHHRGAARTS